MPTKKLSAREETLNHLQACLDTGVRGNLRSAVQKAFDIASNKRVTETTDLEYRQLEQGAKLLDPNRAGLMMRHGKRTGCVWIYRFEHPETSKQIELQFGRYPSLGTAEAREIWRGLREQRQSGAVPSLTTNDVGQTSGPTMNELVRLFLTEYAHKVKAPSSAHEDERMLVKHILPHYADLPAVEFDHIAAKAILSKIHKSGAPREAEKVRSVLSTMFNVAAGKTRKISTLDGTWLAPDHINPVEAVMLPKRQPVSHNPDQSELSNYVRGLDSLDYYGDILRLQMETFARVAEISGLRWDEVDLDNAIWTLPSARSKNRKAHTVMLARQTVERLRTMKTDSVSEFVFPARTDANRPISTTLVINALGKNRDKLGIPAGFTSHSTRHASLTWVAENGGGRDIRDRLSNHTPRQDGADHIYVAAEHNSAAREWTQRWVDHLTILEADNVTTFEGKSA